MTAATDQVGVLFVCMGNICRSPTGEGVFRHYVADAGHGDRIRVDSAGTISYHAGEPADGRMRQAAARRGYTLDSIARQVTRGDLESFDLIIAMDHDNLRDLRRMAGSDPGHIRLLGSYIHGIANPALAPDIPDPYYGGEQGFEAVLDIIESACPALLDHCLRMLRA